MSDCGIVFGATGKSYRNLARRAARNVRQVMPHIPIDLFTDAPLSDPIFDRVHLLDDPNRRPKMDALRLSRFDRTLYLDCDAVMVNDVSDVFELLRRADLVGAHEQFGSSPVSMQSLDYPLPPAFRQINSGVLGVRKSAATDAFLQRWKAEFLRRRLQYDQPLLRQLLFESDLHLTVLPMEYNLMHAPFIRAASPLMMAPRILHIPRLHESDVHDADVERPFNPAELLAAPVRDRFNALLKTDRTLGAKPGLRALSGETLRKVPFLYRMARRLRRTLN